MARNPDPSAFGLNARKGCPVKTFARPFGELAAMVESDKPTTSTGGVSLWHYLSKESEEKTANGKPKFKGGIEMVLLEVSTQDGKKRYTAMSVENLNLLTHNAAGILGCAKGLKAGIAKREAAEKAQAEATAKAERESAVKVAATLKGTGLSRAAIVQAVCAAHQSMTLEAVESIVPTT